MNDMNYEMVFKMGAFCINRTIDSNITMKMSLTYYRIIKTANYQVLITLSKEVNSDD